MLLIIFIVLGQCSGTKKSLRVYGGEDFTVGTFCGKNQHLCTASALSPTWVTAAHHLVDLDEHVFGIQYQKFKLVLSQCSGTRQPLRVYGGEDADLETYPFVVRLEIRMANKLTDGSFIGKHAHLCTASALSATWAVTAAHCLVGLHVYVYGFSFNRLVIRYGSTYSLTPDKKSFSYVLTVIPHPMFNIRVTKGAHRINNDIGLIKATPMPLKSYIKLSAVDYFTMYGYEVVFGGFGGTVKNISDDKKIFGDTLVLKKPLQIFKAVLVKCTEDIISPCLCLGKRCGTIATVCGGDSGGPVIHSSGIVAVLSSGFDSIYCGDETANTYVDLAGMTCPISPFVDWIASYVTN